MSVTFHRPFFYSTTSKVAASIFLAALALDITLDAGILIGLPALVVAGFLSGALLMSPMDSTARPMWLQVLGPLLIPVSMGTLVAPSRLDLTMALESFNDFCIVAAAVLMLVSTYFVGWVIGRLVRSFF